MKDIYNAEGIDKAQGAIKVFDIDHGAKYPKAVAKIVDNTDVLLEFYKYPAEHWIHLRTTKPIEWTFATVRRRTNVLKGPGSCSGDCDGLQADRRRTSPMACRQRTPSGCPCPSRSDLPPRQTRSNAPPTSPRRRTDTNRSNQPGPAAPEEEPAAPEEEEVNRCWCHRWCAVTDPAGCHLGDGLPVRHDRRWPASTPPALNVYRTRYRPVPETPRYDRSRASLLKGPGPAGVRSSGSSHPGHTILDPVTFLEGQPRPTMNSALVCNCAFTPPASATTDNPYAPTHRGPHQLPEATAHLESVPKTGAPHARTPTAPSQPSARGCCIHHVNGS